jgi:hypothetical protein
MASRQLLFRTIYRLGFVPWDGHPLAKTCRTWSKAKAAANRVNVNFVRADVTRPSSEGIGSTFGLIVDTGCLHGMSPEDRDAYVREITAVAAPTRGCCWSSSSPAGTTACLA